MSVVHWSPPDALGDILRQAWRPGVAQPTAIHVRPEVWTRMLARMTTAVRALALGAGCIGDPQRLPLIVDDVLPCYPGFEIHRSVTERMMSA